MTDPFHSKQSGDQVARAFGLSPWPELYTMSGRERRQDRREDRRNSRQERRDNRGAVRRMAVSLDELAQSAKVWTDHGARITVSLEQERLVPEIVITIEPLG